MSPRGRGKAPRVKMTRLSVSLDPATALELKTRARAHKVSKAAYVRAAIIGARPGGGVGEAAHAADTWWDTLSPARRASVHQWLTAGGRVPEIDPHQLDLLTALEETA